MENSDLVCHSVKVLLSCCGSDRDSWGCASEVAGVSMGVQCALCGGIELAHQEFGDEMT